MWTTAALWHGAAGRVKVELEDAGDDAQSRRIVPYLLHRAELAHIHESIREVDPLGSLPPSPWSPHCSPRPLRHRAPLDTVSQRQPWEVQA